MNEIQFIDYLKNDKYVVGKEMLKRGGKNMAGQEDLEYYQAHPELLADYKDKYLIFGNYTKLDSSGRGVASLSWFGERWVLYWFWLDGDFDGDGLLVRARKSLDSGILGSSKLGHFVSVKRVVVQDIIKDIREQLDNLEKLL